MANNTNASQVNLELNLQEQTSPANHNNDNYLMKIQSGVQAEEEFDMQGDKPVMKQYFNRQIQTRKNVSINIDQILQSDIQSGLASVNKSTNLSVGLPTVNKSSELSKNLNISSQHEYETINLMSKSKIVVNKGNNKNRNVLRSSVRTHQQKADHNTRN